MRHAALVGALACVMSLWTAGAATNATQALLKKMFANGTVPGWLPNIDNPLVRVAFPEAQRVYIELHPEIPGLDKEGPVVPQSDPAVTIAPITVTEKKVAAAKTEAAPAVANVEQGPTMGMWRTPHPAPVGPEGPFIGNLTGIASSSAIAFIYLRDGTAIMAERPHGDFRYGQANPLLVNQTTGVGYLGAKYTVSYYNNQPAVPAALQDTSVPLDVKSQAFCVGVAVDSLGNGMMVGGDVAGNDYVYRTASDAAAGFGFPNGYYDVRRYTPGDPKGMQVIANMYDVNSVTGLPNQALDCCIQPSQLDPVVPANCVPDPNCSPRWYPTLMTLPSGNLLILEGAVLAGYDVYANDMNPTWQVLNVETTQLGYKTLLPTTAPAEQAPNSLYPIAFVLPHSGSLLMITGVDTQVFQLNGDSIVGMDRNYLFPPALQYPVSYLLLTANVMLPLRYPSYNPQILLMGGSDFNGNGLNYSQLLTNLFVAVQTSYVQENMAGQARIEGVGVLLPDGTVFLCSGAAQGYDGGGGFGYGNTFNNFQTAPQLYNPSLPIGTRWSGLLADSGVPRGYHNSALLIASGEVMVAGSETTGEWRVQYYVPPYLLNGLPRPTVTSAPCTVAYNAQFAVTFILSAGSLGQVVFIRSAGSTHSNQMDQRMIVLNMQVTSATQLTALSPPDATVAPPGYYMMFLVSAAGVPSVASFVQLKCTTSAPPTNGLVVGQSLPSDGALFSPSDNNFLLTIQTDGNLVTYDSGLFQTYGHTAGAALWASNTYGVGVGPWTFTMQPNCNAAIIDSTGAMTFQTNTAGAGIFPCRVVLRSDSTWAVEDAANNVIAVYGAPQIGNQAPATLPSGRTLEQSYELFSTDYQIFLIVQPDGNMVLYNTARVNQSGQRQGYAALYASNTYGAGPGPLSLVMQADCNLVLYTANGASVFSSGTYVPQPGLNAVPPCHMVVLSNGNGTGTGSFAIIDSTNSTIWSRP